MVDFLERHTRFLLRYSQSVVTALTFGPHIKLRLRQQWTTIRTCSSCVAL